MDVDRTSWGSTLVKNHDENKTYILVKLSESFSNAIQEYSSTARNSNTNATTTNTTSNITTSLTNNHKRPKLHHNNDNFHSKNHANNRANTAPTIKFHGTRGAIRFPNGKSYEFSIQPSDNSVECIKQTKNKWESVGKMVYCLHVKGKDDVYQRTRTKMEAAEQEKRKYCTKLLDAKPTLLSSSSSSSSHINNNNTSNHHNPPCFNNNNTSNTNNNNSNSINNTSSNNNNSTNTNANNNNNNNINNCSSSNSSNNINNLSKYPDITDVKQWKKYKADFDKDYKEYQHLHGYLHKIEEKFGKLRNSLKQSVEGSPEWESAKEQIFNEYERIKGDSSFHRARSKYKQLHNKLSHIKEKILQFKRQQTKRK